MSNTCSIVYLDEKGQPASAYYDNEHLGNDVALSKYLDSMKRIAATRFQKGKADTDNKINAFMERSNKAYSNRKIKTGSVGVTSYTKTNKSEFNEDAQAKISVRNMYIRDLLEANPITYGLTLNQVNTKQYTLSKQTVAGDDADVIIEENPDEFDKKVDGLKQKWKETGQLGTDAHKVLENYGILLKKATNENHVDDIDFKALKAAALKDFTNKADYTKLLNEFDTFIKRIGKGKKLRFEHEVYIKNNKIGAAGIIDLLAFDEQGNAYIFDYKTKERGKEWLFNYKGVKMGDPFADLYDNKETEAALQTSLYKIMLEKEGINVVESKVLYIEADLKLYNNKWEYRNFEFKRDVNLPNYRSHLSKLIKKNKGYDINEVKIIEAGKINSTNDFLLKLSGGQELGKLSQDQIDAKIKSRLIETPNDGKGDFFTNDVTGVKEYYKEGYEARVAQLQKYYKDLETYSSTYTHTVIEYFKNGKPDDTASKDRKLNTEYAQMNNILKGINESTHSLDRVSNFYGMEDADNNILVAIDLVTQEAKFIYVSKDTNSLLDNSKDSHKEKNNIFSDYLSKGAIGNKYKGVEPLKSTTQSLKILSMGIVAMDMKKRGYINSVNTLVEGVVNGYRDNKGNLGIPKHTSMGSVLDQIRILRDETTEDQNEYYKNLLSNKELNNDASYRTDFVNELYKKLDIGFESITSAKSTAGIRDAVEKNNIGSMTNTSLIRELIGLAESMGDALRGSGVSKKDMALHKEYRLVNDAILQLSNAHLSYGDMSKNISRYDLAKITAGIGNKSVQYLDASVRKAKESFNQEFSVFKRERNKLVKALQEETEGVNKLTGQSLGLYTGLFIVDESKLDAAGKAENMNDLYMLKDPGTAGLTKAQSDFIRFFNKHIKKGFQLSLSEDKYEKYIADDSGWKKGQIPLMDASLQTNAENADTMKERWSMGLKAQIGSAVKNTGDKSEEVSIRMSNPLTDESIFGVQKGATRLKLLGIDADGIPINDEPRPLETDLELIVSRFYQDSLRSIEYETSLGLHNALEMAAYVDNAEHFEDSAYLREFMGDFIKLKIYNEYKEEGKLSKTLDVVQKASSLMLFSISARQAIMESVTTSLATGSATMSQAMMKAGNKRFTSKDLAYAGGVLMGGKFASRSTNQTALLVEALRTDFGLYYSDPESQSASSTLQGRKSNWMQTKRLHWFNTMPMRMAKEQMFMAQLQHKGILEALTTDKDGGLSYDVTKDGRYSKLFKNGKLQDVLDLKTPDDKKLLAAYNLFVKKSKEEGNLDNDGLPTRALTYSELTNMKEYSTSLFGSADSDAQMVGKLWSMGRLMSTYKSWFLPKVNNVYKNGAYSEIRTYDKWVADDSLPEGGFYEQRPEYVEGYVQTVLSLAAELKDILKKGKNSDAITNLTPAQRENLARLLSDIIMLLAFSATVVLGLGSMEVFQSGVGANVYKAILDSTGDLNFIAATLSMTDGNLIPVIGVVTRAISNMGDFMGHLAVGEGGEALNDVSKLFGATKLFTK